MIPVNMPCPVYYATSFRPCKVSRHLVIEASDLGPRQLFSQLWNDACDVGFALFNPRTRNTTHWYLAAAERDQEDEIQRWLLKPTPCSVKRFPHLKTWTVTVLND